MIASIVVMGHVTIGFLWNRSNVRVHETKPGCHARGRVLVHTRSLHTGSLANLLVFCILPVPAARPRRGPGSCIASSSNASI